MICLFICNFVMCKLIHLYFEKHEDNFFLMFNLIILIMRSTKNLKPLWLLMLLCLIPVWALAQNVSISGNVKDSTGEPVIGASVLEKGTTRRECKLYVSFDCYKPFSCSI